MEEGETEDEDLLTLVNSGFLREKEMDLWRTATGDPYPMEKNLDEIPMFARFLERGLALPVSDFFKGMLRYYEIEYLNLNPNGILHVSIFFHFCEVFVGINPPLDPVLEVLPAKAAAEHGRPPSSRRCRGPNARRCCWAVLAVQAN
jgi:hypothetical protein